MIPLVDGTTAAEQAPDLHNFTDTASGAHIARSPQSCAVVPAALPLGGIALWRATLHRLIAAKFHPRFTVKSTGRLVDALAKYADWTTGGDIRPTWERLMADTGLKHRNLAYHLAHLREAGLLTWIERGTHLSVKVRIATVYQAQLPDVPAVRAARDEAHQELADAETARPRRRIGQRHITGPAPQRGRAERARADAARGPVTRRKVYRAPSRSPFLHPTPGVCSSAADSSLRGLPGATDKSAAKRGGLKIAETLRAEVPQFRSLKINLAVSLLQPLVEAGWTYQDLRYWLRVDRLPGWYIDAVGAENVYGLANPHKGRLPDPARVTNPFGLLAYRCSGPEWRAFPLPSRLMPQVAAASREMAAGLDPAEPVTAEEQPAGSALVEQIRTRRANLAAKPKTKRRKRKPIAETPAAAPAPAPGPVPAAEPAPLPFERRTMNPKWERHLSELAAADRRARTAAAEPAPAAAAGSGAAAFRAARGRKPGDAWEKLSTQLGYDGAEPIWEWRVQATAEEPGRVDAYAESVERDRARRQGEAAQLAAVHARRARDREIDRLTAAGWDADEAAAHVDGAGKTPEPAAPVCTCAEGAEDGCELCRDQARAALAEFLERPDQP